MTRDVESNFILRVRKKGERAFRDLEGSLDRIARQVGRYGVAAGAAAAGGLTFLTVQSFRNVDALAKKADKIGITTEKLAAYNQLAQLSGGTTQAMAEALTKASKRLGEFNATGGGAAAVWLERLNLNTRELATLSPDQLFARYAEAIRGLTSRSEQLAAMSALLGDESRELIGVIDAGEDAFARAEAEVERFGTALSRVDAAKIEAANDAMFRVRQRAEGLGNVIATRVAPVITAMANRMIEAGGTADDMGATVDRVIDGIAVGVGVVADAFFGWKILFQGIRAGALGMGSVSLSVLAKIEQAAIIAGNKVGSIFGRDNVDPSTGAITVLQDSLAQGAREAASMAGELTRGERPSEAIAAALQQARLDAEAAGRATAKAREKLQGIQAPTFDQNTKEQQADARAQELVEREKERARQRLEAVQATLLEREQVEALAFIRRREVVEEAFQQELIDKERRDSLILGLERDFQTKLTKIAEAGYSEREKFQRASLQAQAADVFSHLTSITQGVATSNKTLFRINQAAAIGNAVVNTYEGVSKTLAKYPWPLAGVLAAAHLAAGLAQVQAIRSAQPGGGTTPSLAGATPTFNDQPVRPNPSEASQTGDTGAGQPGVQIVINGDLLALDDFEERVRRAVSDLSEDDADLGTVVVRTATGR